MPTSERLTGRAGPREAAMNFEERWEMLQKGAHDSRGSLGKPPLPCVHEYKAA